MNNVRQWSKIQAKQSKNILHNTEADKHALQKGIFVIREWLFFLAKSFKIS